MRSKVKRYEVISPAGYNVLGYVWERSLDRAYARAARQYNCAFAVIGS